MPGTLIVNAPHVVHETIDGEAILIHLVTGTYYSLDGVGAELWGALAAGVDRDALVCAGVGRYDGDAIEVEQAVTALVDRLLHDELLIEDPSAPVAHPPQLPPGRVPFAAPALNTYTDMQEFMLVDPLHQVDESAGWPHARVG